MQIVTSCYTEDHTGIRPWSIPDFHLDEKAILIYQLYARLSVINNALFVLQYAECAASPSRTGGTGRSGGRHGAGMPSIRAMHTMSLLAEQVARSRSGQLFFAHLLLPHIPISTMPIATSGIPPTGSRHTTANHCLRIRRNHVQQRYALYLEQVQCLYEKLDAMFAALAGGRRIRSCDHHHPWRPWFAHLSAQARGLQSRRNAGLGLRGRVLTLLEGAGL